MVGDAVHCLGLRGGVDWCRSSWCDASLPDEFPELEGNICSFLKRGLPCGDSPRLDELLLCPRDEISLQTIKKIKRSNHYKVLRQLKADINSQLLFWKFISITPSNSVWRPEMYIERGIFSKPVLNSMLFLEKLFLKKLLKIRSLEI